MLAGQALYQWSRLANPASSLLKGDELEFQNKLPISWESHRISLDLVNKMSYFGTCGEFASASHTDWGSVSMEPFADL